MSYTIIPATLEHALLLNAYLCDEDRDELRVTQSQPLEAITRGIFDSKDPAAIFDRHGHIAAVAGVVPVSGQFGAPWMLSTDASKTQPVAFVRQAREWVEQQLQIYGHLAHQVYRHNGSHIKLLKLLGFQVEEPKSFTQLFLPFHQCVLPSPSELPASL